MVFESSAKILKNSVILAFYFSVTWHVENKYSTKHWLNASCVLGTLTDTP